MWRQVALDKWSGNKSPKISCPSTSHASKTRPSASFTSPLTTVRWIKFSTFDSCSRVSWKETFDVAKRQSSLITFLLCSSAQFYRHSHRTGVGMFRLLEGSNDKWHLGLELHIAYRCQAIQRMLCKWKQNIFFLFSLSSFFAALTYIHNMKTALKANRKPAAHANFTHEKLIKKRPASGIIEIYFLISSFIPRNQIH